MSMAWWFVNRGIALGGGIAKERWWRRWWEREREEDTCLACSSPRL
jgi:hypothetical protein